VLFYEFMPRSLREVLEEMRVKEEEMGEKQLFGLIYGVEEGLNALYNMRATHNCVNLDTILCKNGFYKITDISATTCTLPSIKTSHPTSWSSRALATNF
jgi:hypothetical protein